MNKGGYPPIKGTRGKVSDPASLPPCSSWCVCLRFDAPDFGRTSGGEPRESSVPPALGK